MNNSSSSCRGSRQTARNRATILLARQNPTIFTRVALAGPGAAPAAAHDALQHFLTAHPRGLVELPQDHGKTTQVCLRVAWELGQNPNLRVKLVCATDQLAADRSRFLRATVERNRWVRDVFPALRPARPWAAEAFTVVRTGEGIRGHAAAGRE